MEYVNYYFQIKQIIKINYLFILYEIYRKGFNYDVSPSTNVYLKVVNKSGSTGTVQVTLKYLALEM